MGNLPNIKKFEYDSITLDIFDTVLLRKKYPEELQFLEVADLWVPEFEKILSREVTGYELYTYRRDMRNVLHSAKKYNAANKVGDIDYSILGIEEWFGHTIEALADRYDCILEIPDKDNLLQRMIELELELEKANLFINIQLINWIKEIKRNNPKIKVYFLSDMYLRGEDIVCLLDYFGIAGLFDGGMTSGDEKRGKWSGKLHRHFQQRKKLKGTNLHIGDNHFSDVTMAISSGSKAVHYCSYRNNFLRPFKTRLGYLKLKIIEAKNRKVIARQYKRQFSKSDTYTKISSTSQYIGSLFAPPLAAYMSEMIWFSVFERMQMAAVSSESKTFENFAKKLNKLLNGKADMAYFPVINREQSMLALVGGILGNSNMLAPENTIERILRNERGMLTKADMYNFIFDKKTTSDAIVNKFSDSDFNNLVHSSFVAYGSKKIEAAKAAVDLMVASLDGDQFFILDVGWNGTVQAMLQQYLLSQKKKTIVNGLYLGFRENSRRKLLIKGNAEGWLLHDIGSMPDSDFFVPDIWEFVYTNKSYGVDIQEDIQKGLGDGIEYYVQSIHASPREFFIAVKDDLRRLFIKPHHREIALLGELKFDAGFVGPKGTRLVDMTLTPVSVIKKLILHPRKFIEYLKQPYCWATGYVRFYHIEMITKFLLRLIRLFSA